MKNMIYDLQQEILKPDCDIVSILRKAHLLAIKLNDDEFCSWVKNELNGYSSSKDVPKYRNIQGVVKSNNPINGWIPVIIQDQDIENMLTHSLLYQSAGDLIQYSKRDDNLFIPFSGGISQHISELANYPYIFESALFITKESLIGVIEQIKNHVWEWVSKIDQGENLIMSNSSQPKLFDLINRIPDIEKNFKETDIKGFPKVETIYDVPTFIMWGEEIKAEIRKLKQDDLTKEILLLFDKFTGWTDKRLFKELEAKLKIIMINYDDYIINNNDKQESLKPSYTPSHSITNIYFQGDITDSNIATGNHVDQEHESSPEETKSWFEKYWFPLIIALIGAISTIITSII